ncbi:MAG: isochorismatase family protein [Thermoleophilia bacterium]|nr:isochorismatase family protein [Thermoleophilia bacterium]
MATRHPHIANADSSALLIVDVQEAFRPHIIGFDAMVSAINLVARGCLRLDVPIAISEQYPAGLGSTVREIDDAFHGVSPKPWLFEKLEVSSVAAPAWADAPPAVASAETIIVVGIETHVCVSQSVLDLIAGGTKTVQVVADAVGSRDPWQKSVALERLAREGAVITTAETVLFELLGVAGTPEFKDIQRLIKLYDAARSAARTQEVTA